jgi:hypothetical protein
VVACGVAVLVGAPQQLGPRPRCRYPHDRPRRPDHRRDRHQPQAVHTPAEHHAVRLRVHGSGTAIVKWPILVQNVSALPLFEGVEACLLTGMSLLAFLGLRYPVAMLPILLFEVTWKAIWIAAVAVPHLVADDLDPQHVTCWSTAPLSSSLSRSSRGDMSGSATSAHQGMRGVDERHPAVTCRPSSPKASGSCRAAVRWSLSVNEYEARPETAGHRARQGSGTRQHPIQRPRPSQPAGREDRGDSAAHRRLMPRRR